MLISDPTLTYCFRPEIGRFNEQRGIHLSRLYSWLGPVGLPTSNWNKGDARRPRDDLPIMHRDKPIIVLLRRRFHAFWCRLGQFFNKPACRPHVRQSPKCLHRVENKPGEPRNTARAGTTVFGGSTVLSSIFAQSLIIQNFPC